MALVGRRLRMAKRIRAALDRTIRSELRDPRLLDCVIADVEVAADLSFAHVYVAAGPLAVAAAKDQSELADQQVALLNQAAPFLRGRLSKAISAKRLPGLRFYPDCRVRDWSVLRQQVQALEVGEPDTSSDGDA